MGFRPDQVLVTIPTRDPSYSRPLEEVRSARTLSSDLEVLTRAHDARLDRRTGRANERVFNGGVIARWIQNNAEERQPRGHGRANRRSAFAYASGKGEGIQAA
jgi:hypothetical protein